MSEQAIKNLKKRFVGVQLISFLVVMLFFGACIYLANAVIVRNTIRTTLDYIIENDGELLPHGDITEEDVAGDASNRELFESLQEALGVIRRFGIETRYQTRYFAVHYDASGNVVQMNMNHIAALTEEEAISLGNRMFAKIIFIINGLQRIKGRCSWPLMQQRRWRRITGFSGSPASSCSSERSSAS